MKQNDDTEAFHELKRCSGSFLFISSPGPVVSLHYQHTMVQELYIIIN